MFATKLRSVQRNSWRLAGKPEFSGKGGFLILWEFMFSLLVLYLLLSVCEMAQSTARIDRKIRQRLFASYFAEGITIESLTSRGVGLQSFEVAVPCHISALGSLRTDFQRISFDRAFLPDVDIMRYTESSHYGDTVNTSVTWYEAGVERTIVVSATL